METIHMILFHPVPEHGKDLPRKLFSCKVHLRDTLDPGGACMKTADMVKSCLEIYSACNGAALRDLHTMAIGLLAGNSCRVRVSARRNTESEKVCELIDELLGLPEFQALEPPEKDIIS